MADNLKMAEAQLARARVLLALGRHPEAERDADLCLSLRRRKLTLKHPATAEAVAGARCPGLRVLVTCRIVMKSLQPRKNSQ